MNEALKYFVFNKEADFQRGFGLDMAVSSAGLRIAPGAAGRAGIYFSRLLDSRDKETVWHRMVVQSEALGDASIRFSIYAAEERRVWTDGRETDLEDYLRDPGVSAGQKAEILRPFLVKTVLNPRDILLHAARGRYLWFCIELFGQGDESPVIRRMKIYLPRQSWLGYLPELYQVDAKSKSFVERYLNIFQSLYTDMEENIDRVARYFDPDAVDGPFLQWLAEWLDIDDAYIWTPDQLRYLVQNGRRLYKIRGTRRAVADMVALYLGEEPYIVEHWQLDGSEGDARTGGLLARLYGDSSYYFTVVVHERCVPSPKEHKTLLKVIEGAKPAHVEANVVVLKPYIFLDKYSYLGMNSVLGQYRPVHLDGFSALPFTGIRGGGAQNPA